MAITVDIDTVKKGNKSCVFSDSNKQCQGLHIEFLPFQLHIASCYYITDAILLNSYLQILYYMLDTSSNLAIIYVDYNHHR